MAIKIIVDSTCDIDMSLQEELHIDILPLTVHFGDEEFRDGIDISKKDFFKRMRTAAKSPTTSQVTPGAFEKLFQQYTKEGHDIIVITIASQLSGTYQSAHIAKTTVKNDKIHLIDSGTTTMGLAWLVYEAIAMREQGHDANSIVEQMTLLKKKVTIYAMIENLEYLKKGGRLSTAGATVGTILNLKPIIQIKNGILTVVQKTRGNAKAHKWILNKVTEDHIDTTKPIFFGHADASEMLKPFIKTSTEKLNPSSIQTTEIGIAIGAHGGPGCIGIGFVTI